MYFDGSKIAFLKNRNQIYNKDNKNGNFNFTKFVNFRVKFKSL